MRMYSRSTGTLHVVPRIQPVADHVSIAGALRADDFRELKARGFQTIVDLRWNGEPTPFGLSPREERCRAAELGFTHFQIPVISTALDRPTVEAVHRTLAIAERPVLVHCASGRRAAVLVIMDLACTAGWTPTQCLERLDALGFDCAEMPRLREFLVRYLGTRRGESGSALGALDTRAGQRSPRPNRRTAGHV